MPGPRVAYILPWFPKPSETFILDEVNTLCRLGLDLTVYTLYGPQDPRLVGGMAPSLAPVNRLGLPLLKKLAHEAINLKSNWGSQARPFVIRVLARRWRSLETMGEAFWAALAGVYLARSFQSAEIDHIHAPWASGPATAAWVASRLSGIPFSFCGRAHDVFPDDGALVEKLTDAVMVRTENQAVKRHLATLAPPAAGKLVNIYPGAPLMPIPEPSRPVPPPYHLLALGRFVPKKGYPLLLESCRRLADLGVDFRLTLAGDGPERPQIQKLISKYGLEPRVRLPGFLPHRQVPSLFQNAHLFIMSSLIAPSGDRDGIPTVILEALMHEVPVVASAVSGIPEVIRPGETGWLVPPGDSRALAQAVMEALTNPQESRRRAQSGRELVKREFASQKNYAKLKACFERLARTV